MITTIELGKKYTPPDGGNALIFHSLSKDGEYNYSIQGVFTFAPLFCRLQEALDMVNGKKKELA